jgi:hypothetical protein
MDRGTMCRACLFLVMEDCHAVCCECLRDLSRSSAGRLAGLVSLRLLHAIRSVTKTAWLVLPGTNVATFVALGSYLRLPRDQKGMSDPVCEYV